MDFFLRRDFSGSIEALEKFMNDDEVIGLRAAHLHCNIAAAQVHLELYRNAIKSCQMALAKDKYCLNAYVLQGNCYAALGKVEKAHEVWEQGLRMANDDISALSSDVCVALELYGLVNNKGDCKMSFVPPEPQSEPEPPHVHPVDDQTKDPNDGDKNIPRSDQTPPATDKTEAKGKKKAKKKSASKSALVALHNQYVGSQDQCVANPLYIKAVKANLSNASGDDLIDDLIACGYLQVNTGNLDSAVAIFSSLLTHRADLPAALLGLGSVHAMKGKFDDAITSFTAAIATDPSISDAWKRRGQTKAAKGLVVDALSDLTRALQLGSDPDISSQRGLVHHQCRSFRRALQDFRTAEKGGLRTAPLYNYIGMCEGQLGNIQKSIESHDVAVRIDPTFKEALLNAAQMYKEWGRWREAVQGFQRVVATEPKFHQGHNYFAMLLHALGRPLSALDCTLKALALTSQGQQIPALTLAGVCCASVGACAEAVSYFDRVLALDPDNPCWFQREVAIFVWSRLDKDLTSFNLDSGVDPRVKDGWCKRAPWRQVMMAGAGTGAGTGASGGLSKRKPSSPPTHEVYKPLKIPTHIDVPDVESCKTVQLSADLSQLLDLTRPLQKWIQLNCQGFLPNARQQKMFGIAVLEMAQGLHSHHLSIRDAGPGMQVPNDRSSRSPGPGVGAGAANPRAQGSSSAQSSSSCSSSSSASTGKRRAESHIFGWRDFFDIGVRWRQVSEPNDPVWWIDRLPTKAFKEGFGLQTPIVNGQLKTVRYYSYFPQAIDIMKSMMTESTYYNAAGAPVCLNSLQLEALAKATQLEDLYAITKEDFYVIKPCPSLLRSGVGMEGTRLTLVAHDPEGFEFTIRTPGTPARWALFDAEISACFQRVVEALAAGGGDGTERDPLQYSQEILRLALELFYFWVTFAPLSRGTAACGYMAVTAVLLSCGLTFAGEQLLPENKQLDWEAIFAPDVKSFVSAVMPWFHVCASNVGVEDLQVSTVVPNLRAMISVLAGGATR